MGKQKRSRLMICHQFLAWLCVQVKFICILYNIYTYIRSRRGKTWQKQTKRRSFRSRIVWAIKNIKSNMIMKLPLKWFTENGNYQQLQIVVCFCIYSRYAWILWTLVWSYLAFYVLRIFTWSAMRLSISHVWATLSFPHSMLVFWFAIAFAVLIFLLHFSSTNKIIDAHESNFSARLWFLVAFFFCHKQFIFWHDVLFFFCSFLAIEMLLHHFACPHQNERE